MMDHTQIHLDRFDLDGYDGMTLILGARCRDGVVLAADRKLSSIGDRGIQYQYGDKITGELWGVLTGFSGDAGAFQIFAMTLHDYVRTTRRERIEETFRQPFIPGRHFDEPGPTIEQMKLRVSHIQDDFFKKNDKYRCKILMTVSSIHTDGQASLLLFEPDGRCTPLTKPTAIGTGTPYASYFLERYWEHNNTTMKQFAQLSDFIIRYVGSDERPLDNSVGLKIQHNIYQYPQIFYIPDKPEDHCPIKNGIQTVDCPVEDNELNQFRTNSNNMIRRLNELPPPWPDS
ncbi:MAG TPA: hypothetical protein VH500_02600 [Nitrososphaeraceae archaeon]|jgi:20S proteasome alpha/beta subunit